MEFLELLVSAPLFFVWLVWVTGMVRKVFNGLSDEVCVLISLFVITPVTLMSILGFFTFVR